jgi:putative heme iron utilization protein
MSLSPELVSLVRGMLLNRSVAALATLHEGLPCASMVPFAATLATGRLALVVHVSGLAAHTRDMQSHPEVCLLVTVAESADIAPQALPRISIPAVAEFVPQDHPEYAAFEATYLAKFPEAAPLFSFADFSLVALVPTSARLVAGFARAATLSADSLRAALDEAIHPSRG